MQTIPRCLLQTIPALALLSTVPLAEAAEPSVAECLGANEKSIALRRESKFQAASEQLLVCSAVSCPAEIRKECAERIAKVNAAIPTILFEVKDANGNDLVAVHVSVDGQAANDRTEGVAIPLDPGLHTFKFEAKGFAPVEKSVVLQQGEKDRRERITLSREAVNEVTKPPATTVPPAPADLVDQQTSARVRPTSATPSESTSRADHLRIGAFIAGGVGVVSIGVGSVFGILAKRSYDASNEDGHCRATGCDEKGLQRRDDAFKQARLSTVFVLGGAAFSAGAVALYLVSTPRRERPVASRISLTPLFATSGGGVALSGGF